MICRLFVAMESLPASYGSKRRCLYDELGMGAQK